MTLLQVNLTKLKLEYLKIPVLSASCKSVTLTQLTMLILDAHFFILSCITQDTTPIPQIFQKLLRQKILDLAAISKSKMELNEKSRI